MARWIRPTTRARLVARGEATCVYCGRERLAVGETECGGRAPDHAATLDHVVPRDLGGSNAPTNLVCACGRCNSRRQNTRLNAWALQLGTERAEAATPADAADRPAVVSEVAARLADQIVRRVRAQARRALPATEAVA